MGFMSFRLDLNFAFLIYSQLLQQSPATEANKSSTPVVKAQTASAQVENAAKGTVTVIDQAKAQILSSVKPTLEDPKMQSRVALHTAQLGQIPLKSGSQ